MFISCNRCGFLALFYRNKAEYRTKCVVTSKISLLFYLFILTRRIFIITTKTDFRKYLRVLSKSLNANHREQNADQNEEQARARADN